MAFGKIKAGQAYVEGRFNGNPIQKGLRKMDLAFRRFVRSNIPNGRQLDKAYRGVTAAVKSAGTAAAWTAKQFGKMAVLGKKAAGAIRNGMLGVGKGLGAAGKGMQSAGQSALGGGLVGGLGLGLSAAKAAEFDDAIRMTGAVAQATGEEFDSLRNKALDLGRTTSFTAVQVANLMAELGRAGFKPTEIENMTGAVLDLSRATGTDATQAAGIMAATLRQFKLQATDATRVADMFTATANKTFNTVEALGESMQYAGPVAASLGYSMERTLAILGGLGNVGIQGSEAGTALRRLSTLSAAEAKKFEENFGVMTKDASGQARDLVDILGEVAEATKDLGSAERAEKYNNVFGLLGITGATAIGAGVADIRKLYQEMQNLNGVAAKTAKEMDAGLGGAWRMLTSAVEGAVIAIGQSMAPTLISAGNALQQFAGWVTAVTEKSSNWVMYAMTAVVALTTLGVGVYAAGTAMVWMGATVTTLTGVITFLVTAFQMLLTPAGAVAAAIAAGTVALGYMAVKAGALDGVMSWLAERFGVLSEMFQQALSSIATALKAGDIEAAAAVAWNALKVLWLKGTNELLTLWDRFSNSVVDKWEAITGYISGIWHRAMGKIADKIIGVQIVMAKLMGPLKNKEKIAQLEEARRINRIDTAMKAGGNPFASQDRRDAADARANARAKEIALAQDDFIRATYVADDAMDKAARMADAERKKKEAEKAQAEALARGGSVPGLPGAPAADKKAEDTVAAGVEKAAENPALIGGTQAEADAMARLFNDLPNEQDKVAEAVRQGAQDVVDAIKGQKEELKPVAEMMPDLRDILPTSIANAADAQGRIASPATDAQLAYETRRQRITGEYTGDKSFGYARANALRQARERLVANREAAQEAFRANGRGAVATGGGAAGGRNDTAKAIEQLQAKLDRNHREAMRNKTVVLPSDYRGVS